MKPFVNSLETTTERENDQNVPLDTHDEVNLRLSGDVEVSVGLGLPLQADLLAFLLLVLVDVLFSALEDDLTLGLGSLLNQEPT